MLQRALIRPVGHLLPFASDRAKAIIPKGFCLLLSEGWEKVADRPDEGSAVFDSINGDQTLNNLLVGRQRQECFEVL